ncbi:MAG TPA: DUF3109 family protein [Candidatus Barnesiella excrementipullorum]|uniref:DUF3109 family protein n=1 Tax=Candidatus Barnesiella excrementipullorum TaxID=2838479 RepID=A0A9D1VQY8_9BACT|nr:DUF3109 family protein [Candidatus Barnesiella excrementipullorum]
MLQIENTLVSLDIIERFFVCNIEACRGECCIDGDAGAPITPEERKAIEEALPAVWDDLSPAAQAVIREQGVAYIDEEADLVTSIVDGRDCVFTCYGNNGVCYCALEKAYREGRSAFFKPLSCHLYPVRVQRWANGYTAFNYHRWKICKAAEVLGRHEKVRVYQFLKEPLIRCMGEEWYKTLSEVADEYLKATGE